MHKVYNTCIENIHNTQRHELYKEAITRILNVVNKNKVNVFNTIADVVYVALGERIV